MPVLGPEAGFDPARPPAGWVVEGGARGRLGVAFVAGVPALRVGPGEGRFVFARHTDVVLLAAPYLSWAWNVEAPAEGPHPVRLVVGFVGGDPKRGSWGSRPLAWLGSALPPHDRRLWLVWGASALARGSLEPAADEAAASASYVVRGGRENGGAWRLETVDLAQLYARAWPGDALGRARIAFIGVGSGAAETRAHVAGIVLSR